MTDPTATDSNEPRCSFCGRTASQTDDMVQGPGARICASCIQDARGMLDEGAGSGGTKQKPVLEAVDYRSAYVILTYLPAPLRDFFRDVHGDSGGDLIRMALGVHTCRTDLGMDVPTAMTRAMEFEMKECLNDPRHQN